MTNKEKTEIKKVAKDVMFNVLGFNPTLNDIVLLECSYDGLRYDYVLFEINRKPSINYRVSFYNNKYNLELITVDVNNDYKWINEIEL